MENLELIENKKELSCADRIDRNFQDRFEEIKEDFKDRDFFPANYFEQKGLSVDLVEKEDHYYISYQLSCGDQADEFRFWKSGKITYHFLDWFDHAEKDVTVMTRQDPVMQKFADLFTRIYEGLFEHMRYLD